MKLHKTVFRIKGEWVIYYFNPTNRHEIIYKNDPVMGTESWTEVDSVGRKIRFADNFGNWWKKDYLFEPHGDSIWEGGNNIMLYTDNHGIKLEYVFNKKGNRIIGIVRLLANGEEKTRKLEYTIDGILARTEDDDGYEWWDARFSSKKEDAPVEEGEVDEKDIHPFEFEK
jgi:hypothetical protein